MCKKALDVEADDSSLPLPLTTSIVSNMVTTSVRRDLPLFTRVFSQTVWHASNYLTASQVFRPRKWECDFLVLRTAAQRRMLKTPQVCPAVPSEQNQRSAGPKSLGRRDHVMGATTIMTSWTLAPVFCLTNFCRLDSWSPSAWSKLFSEVSMFVSDVLIVLALLASWTSVCLSSSAPLWLSHSCVSASLGVSVAVFVCLYHDSLHKKVHAPWTVNYSVRQ